MITLGSNIKKYRKDRKITQEQLAEVLGVSDQAVSRWENGTTYPDIELLPTIAVYFGVTMDELMGMEAYKDESDIAEILKKREELRNRGEVVKSYEMLRKAVKRYPKNYELLSALVADLCFANVYNEEIRLNNLHEAEGLIDRILAECPDEQICRNMVGEKVFLLNWLERTDEAVALAEKALPEMKDARESYLKHILTGEKKRAFCRQYMMDLYYEMWLTIDEYADRNSEDDSITLPERIALLEKNIALTEWLFEGNYGLNNWQMSYWHEYIARYEAKLKNAEAALHIWKRPQSTSLPATLFPKKSRSPRRFFEERSSALRKMPRITHTANATGLPAGWKGKSSTLSEGMSALRPSRRRVQNTERIKPTVD